MGSSVENGSSLRFSANAISSRGRESEEMMGTNSLNPPSTSQSRSSAGRSLSAAPARFQSTSNGCVCSNTRSASTEPGGSGRMLPDATCSCLS